MLILLFYLIAVFQDKVLLVSNIKNIRYLIQFILSNGIPF